MRFKIISLIDTEFIETWSVSNVEKISLCLKRGDFDLHVKIVFIHIVIFFEFLIVGREIILAANERERKGLGELIIMIIPHLSLNCFFCPPNTPDIYSTSA